MATVGRAVVVTGASTGIGEACAEALHGAGYHVYAGVRKGADGDRLRGRMRDRLTPLMLDVTDAGHIAEAVGMVSRAHGEAGLHGLVNNAGIVVAGALEYLPLDDIRRQLEVNVTAQIAVTQAFLPLLRRARGRVVMMGSSSGKLATPFLGPYAMSKFALEALADSWRVELMRAGVHVSIVEPGAIQTPIWDKSRDVAESLAAAIPEEGQAYYGAAFERLRAQVAETTARAIPPSRVARCVLHALEARTPRTRYPVGFDARMQHWLAAILPDRVRDRIVQRVLGL